MSELPLLNQNIEKTLVDATRAGFVNFLEEKADKKAKMKVSGGYAWTRSNHIDDSIAEILDKDGLGSYSPHKVAGWDFLIFEFEVNHKNIWIAQKGSSFVSKLKSATNKKNVHKNYISKWSKNINKQYSDLFRGEGKQLSLLNDVPDLFDAPEDVAGESSLADAFYLLIYNISSNVDIDKISLNLVYNGQIKLVKDLSELNASSEVKVPDVYTNDDILSKDLALSEEYTYYDTQDVRDVEENNKKAN